MAIITIQRPIDGAFDGSYQAMHKWQAELATTLAIGRSGGTWSAYPRPALSP